MSLSDPSARALAPRLSFLELFSDAVRLAASRWALLIKVGLILLVLTVVRWLLFGDVQQLPDEAAADFVATEPRHWLLLLVEIPFYSVAAVACHRLFLVGPGEVQGLKAYSFNGRVLRFFGYLALITMLFTLLGGMSAVFGVILLTLIPGLGLLPAPILALLTLVIMLPAGAVMASWSLLLPAVALEHPHRGLKGAFEMAEGHRWTLTLAVFVTPTLPMFVLPWLPIWHFTGADMVMGFLSLVFAVIALAMLSLAYARLHGFQPEAESQQACNALG